MKWKCFSRLERTVYLSHFCIKCTVVCLGSVGSARFWLPGSGSAKTCVSRDKMSIKNCKKNLFLLSIFKYEPMKNRLIIIISWFLLNGANFNMKESEKTRQKIWKFCFVKKKSANLKEMTWIRIRILDLHLKKGSEPRSFL